MADWDWQHLGIQAVLSLISGAGGWGLAIWRGGYNQRAKEQAVKDDYTKRINDLREEVRTAMTAFAKDADNRNEALVEQFAETLNGLRRKIDDNELHTERHFLRKDEFKDFREEYREDMRDLKALIQNGHS